MLLRCVILLSFLVSFSEASQFRLSAGLCEKLKLPDGAECGNLIRPENPQKSGGRKISIFLVRLPSRAKTTPSTDAVFVLSGGPGQGAASGIIGSEGKEFDDLRQKRDVVFVDQRGTGRSHPLNCDLRGGSLASYFEQLFPKDRLLACRHELEKDGDLTMYTTAIAADDLEATRQALGYASLDLLGGSYGAKAAFIFLRRYPQRVRTMALQSVSTTAFRLPLPFARAGQEVLDHIFDGCASDTKCSQAFPKLRAEFAGVVNSLKKSGVDFEMKNPAHNQVEKIHMTYPVFAERLRQLLYVPEFARMVPLLVHRAASGDFLPFAQLAFLFASTVEKEVSLGMYFSVTCSEDLPLFGEKEIIAETSGTFLGDTRVREHQKACSVWPKANVPPAFLQSVHSDVPVLMVSGEWDPATPASFAKEAAKYLSHAALVVLPKASHESGQACVRNLITHFVDNPSADLDTSCVSEMKLPDFYTELPPDFLEP